MRLESLAWLSVNPRYTQRLVLAVGRRCRYATIKDGAQEMDLDWKTVKDLDILYMQQQLEMAGPPAPLAIGIDELSIGPGHSYRIVVSDLHRKRAIWFGGADRTEASMDLLCQFTPGNQGENQPDRDEHVEAVSRLGEATSAASRDHL